MHAADMVHLRPLNRSIPFYMLFLSDTPSRRDEDDGDAASSIDLRSAAQGGGGGDGVRDASSGVGA
ncbi:unnamed protein product [Ectocarpus sp. CCAP 1310/34]|nr:unnamed protein product [Ectocarpus sp. CCAP 1310/34]